MNIIIKLALAIVAVVSFVLAGVARTVPGGAGADEQQQRQAHHHQQVLDRT